MSSSFSVWNRILLYTPHSPEMGNTVCLGDGGDKELKLNLCACVCCVCVRGDDELRKRGGTDTQLDLENMYTIIEIMFCTTTNIIQLLIYKYSYV